MYNSSYGAYGSLADYFAQRGGTGSPGKAGGAGYTNDISYGGGGQGSDVQQPSASSGSGWISAAASTASTDKSSFSTPFQQGFGGIANFQVIGSPGAVGASQVPVTGPPTLTATPYSGSSAAGSSSVAVIALMVLLAIAAAKFVLK